MRDSGCSWGQWKLRGNVGDAEGEQVASNGKALLGEHYDRDHLTYEEIEDLDLAVVTEKGETV